MSRRPRQTDIQTPIGKEVLERRRTALSMNRIQSSLVLLVKPCEWCCYGPCACSYILKLRPDGELGHLHDVALACLKEPWPHRAACPCPRCYSLRLASWS